MVTPISLGPLSNRGKKHTILPVETQDELTGALPHPKASLYPTLDIYIRISHIT